MDDSAPGDIYAGKKKPPASAGVFSFAFEYIYAVMEKLCSALRYINIGIIYMVSEGTREKGTDMFDKADMKSRAKRMKSIVNEITAGNDTKAHELINEYATWYEVSEESAAELATELISCK